MADGMADSDLNESILYSRISCYELFEFVMNSARNSADFELKHPGPRLRAAGRAHFLPPTSPIEREPDVLASTPNSELESNPQPVPGSESPALPAQTEHMALATAMRASHAAAAAAAAADAASSEVDEQERAREAECAATCSSVRSLQARSRSCMRVSFFMS